MLWHACFCPEAFPITVFVNILMKTKVINSLTYVLQLVLVTSEQVYNAFVIVVKTMINNIFFLVYCAREGITFCHIHVYLTTRGGSRAAATSKMESFMIIVNGFHQLTIITKRSILDVAVALDPPLTTLLLHSNEIFKWNSLNYSGNIVDGRVISWGIRMGM